VDQDGSLFRPSGILVPRSGSGPGGAGASHSQRRGGGGSADEGEGEGEGESVPVLFLGLLFVVLFAMVNEILSLVTEVCFEPGDYGETRRS